jgi:hypothetical protein
MELTLGRRSPQAVQELEQLQQMERSTAGESPLTTEGVLRLLRDDVHSALISSRLEQGGLAAVVANADDDERIIDERVKALCAKWNLDDPTQWSRFEPVGIRKGIAELCARVEKVFATHNWELPEFPVVGTLTTGQVSAVTQKGNTGAPLILVDNGFFKFAGVLAQLAVLAPSEFKTPGPVNAAMLQLVADLVATHTVLNTCLYLFKRPTPAQFAGRVERLHHAICAFVIGHEFGHIFAGDLNAHPVTPLDDRTRRAKEIDADKFGFVAAIESSEDGTEAVFGPFLYLTGLALLDGATAAFEGREEMPMTTADDGDYPTPYERIMHLFDWIATMKFPPDFAAAVQAAADCCNAIQTAWKQVLPAFLDARDELAAYKPNARGPVMLPDARTFAVVSILWQHVLAQA